MGKTIIHVNQHKIKKNMARLKRGESLEPTITVKDKGGRGKADYGDRVTILVDGKPVGLQLIGRHFEEARLLNVAHRFQQATDWHEQKPAGIEGGDAQ